MVAQKNIAPTFEEHTSSFSNNVPTEQPTNNRAEFLEDAEAIRPRTKEVLKYILGIADTALSNLNTPPLNLKIFPSLSMKKTFRDGGIKNGKRLDEKALREKGAYNPLSNEHEPRYNKVKDGHRVQAEVGTHEEWLALSILLEVLQNNGQDKKILPYDAEIIKCKNHILEPTATGYFFFRANIKISLPEGSARPYHIIELKFVLRDFENDSQNKRVPLNYRGKKIKVNSHELLEKKREIEEKLKTYNCEKNNPSVPRILMNEMYEIKESCLDLHNPLAKKYKMGSIESNPKASDSLKEHYKKLDQISEELNRY